MKFSIANSVFEKFPELQIGVLIVNGFNNKGDNPEIAEMLKNETNRIRTNFTLENLQENPVISAWREAYRSFGAKPKKYKCSVENLYRMILEGIDLRHINKVVDLYNYISLKYLCPVGGDDIDKVDGDVSLTIAKGNENFIRLNSDEIDHPKEGEVIYLDDKEVLCRRWNWRECDKSKMTEETKNAILVIEGLPPMAEEELQDALGELSELVNKYCGGTTKTHILNKENSGISVS